VKLSPTRKAFGFTLVEIMVASSIGLLITAGAIVFFQFAGVSMSGATSQSLINQRAGNTIEFIQSRARLATFVSNDASGNTLSLAFDDNTSVDSDGDGRAYNDRDHYERFQFVGVNGSTNSTSTNSLVYIPDITSTNLQVLIPSGVHNLPGFNIFTVTNGSTIVVRFSIVDGYGPDRYQTVDIQGTAVPLNRSSSTNVVSILP
jgi:type II secretory pathway pseudopilin PulG